MREKCKKRKEKVNKRTKRGKKWHQSITEEETHTQKKRNER